MSFECRYFTIDDSKLEEFDRAYPKVSVMDELLRMRIWLEANPTKACKYKKFNRFVVNWLTATERKMEEAVAKAQVPSYKDMKVRAEAMHGKAPELPLGSRINPEVVKRWLERSRPKGAK